MFVKVTTSYHDLEFKADMPKGVILEVTKERAEVLMNAGKAVEFNFPAPAKPKKAEETLEVKVEEVAPVEDINTVPEEQATEETSDKKESDEDKWSEPKATETVGE